MIRRRWAALFAICAVLQALLFPLAGQAAENKTQIRLLLSAETARPGDIVWAGLEMDMPKGWHTYWRYGGDSGEPTEIKWTLPAGFSAGEINWPLPEKEIDTAGDTSFISYVYKNRTVLLVPITIDKSAHPGPVTITASAKWMECSDICLMASADATATLTVGDTAKPSAAAGLLAEWRAKVPPLDTSSSASAYWDSAPVNIKEKSRDWVIEWRTNAVPADFYPFGGGKFDVQGSTETAPAPAGTIRLRKTVKTNEAAWPKEIGGVLVGRVGKSGEFGVEVHLAVGAAAPSGSPAPAAVGNNTPPTSSLASMLVLAFLGGLILNVMPCVLPVIALKILGFVNQSKEEPRRVRQLGAVYGIGVLASFLVLAGLAIAAQKAGGLANWGDAFRHPQFQIILTILMTLIALNLFGVFEITLGTKAMGAASELSGRSGFGGAFFNGVLATVLATPCTAPFLGVALAFAFTQSPIVTIAVFLAAGLGLAFPFVAICMDPRLLRLLPKPGAWMEKFKNAMGFPLLATAVWLAWVYSSRQDDELWLGLFLVVLALAAWLWGQFVQRGQSHRGLAVLICLLIVAADVGVILEGQLHWLSPPQSGDGAIDWKPWSQNAVEAAQKAGHPVLVDFTAKSCLTCKLNLASSLEIDRTRAKLKQIGAVALKADYTTEDPAIGKELRSFGTSGVPLVLVYSRDASRAPQVLPTFLTPSIVLAALDKAAD